METASFQLKDYQFTRVELHKANLKSTDLGLSFDVSGQFSKINGVSNFQLTFETIAQSKGAEDDFLHIVCVANFVFENVSTQEEIPDFFYTNSVAILFPYVRAYVSLLTSQAQVRPLVLPTLNLTHLSEPLKANTTTKSE
ncbi:protein-export chaperone SecB [Parapedobacter soli]|uniref:protein-export chaperone SecB n=1 Tax=Parapedobacter soli TaxID=416955 RepID=UPI0021C8C999|nr:protein-export chaperone SecB [Parapedobacter soli]